MIMFATSIRRGAWGVIYVCVVRQALVAVWLWVTVHESVALWSAVGGVWRVPGRGLRAERERRAHAGGAMTLLANAQRPRARPVETRRSRRARGPTEALGYAVAHG